MARALFDASEVQLPLVETKTGKAGRTEAVASQMVKVKSKVTKQKLAHRAARCAEVVGRIEPRESMHLISAAEWSAHNLIEHLIKQTGPVDLWFATWSISEDGLRALLRMRDAGSLLSVNAVLDWRIHVRNRQVAQLARAQVDSLKVYSCHAKIYILRNESWGISIVSSANLTNNPRIEASAITEGAELADWHIAWISDVLRGAAPFEVEDGKEENADH